VYVSYMTHTDVASSERERHMCDTRVCVCVRVRVCVCVCERENVGVCVCEVDDTHTTHADVTSIKRDTYM